MVNCNLLEWISATSDYFRVGEFAWALFLMPIRIYRLNKEDFAERIRKFWAELVYFRRKVQRIWSSRYPKLLFGVYAFLILLSPFAQIGTTHAPVLAVEVVAQIEREKEIDQLREELRLFLERYNSKLGPDYIEAVIAVEKNHNVPGFSKLATAVALNESGLGRVYPRDSYNIWGIGASSPDRWIDYDSWKEGATDFYQVVRRLGLEQVTYQDLIRISRAYVGTSKWYQWGNRIWHFYLQI